MLIFIALEIEDFDSDQLVQQRILSQEYWTKAALTKFLFELQEFHSYLIIEVLAKGVK